MSLNKKTGIFFSIRWRMLLVFSGLFTLVFAGAFYWFYHFFTDLALENLYANLLAVAHSAAQGVDADLHQALYDDPLYDETQAWPMGMEDARFWAIAEWLQIVHQSNPRAYIYTFVSPEPGVVEFIVSHGALEQPAAGAPFRARYEPQPPSVILEGLKAETLSKNIVQDDWGAWVSGFVPLYNAEGQIVAALGVDYQANDVVELQNQIKSAALPAFGITYLVLLIAIVLIANQITAPIVSLSQVANRIGEGQYELAQTKDASWRDEVSTLTEIFNLMVEKVRAREEKLKRQVADLKIMIDHSKQAEQVKAITETDFFYELQQKAKEMRARRAKY